MLPDNTIIYPFSLLLSWLFHSRKGTTLLFFATFSISIIRRGGRRIFFFRGGITAGAATP
jgi:hypothetical protein